MCTHTSHMCAQVTSTPFSLSEVQSFFTLFTIPLLVLKSVVQLIHHQQVSGQW